MAYTRKHLLQRIREVNEIYLREHERGVSNEYIYAHYIRNKYFISRATFYDYLRCPYERQIQELETRESLKKIQNPTINFEDYDDRTDEGQDSPSEDRD